MKPLFIFFVFIGMLTLSPLKPVDLNALRSQDIRITVDGEVAHPGTYTLAPYSNVQDALDKAVPMEHADLARFNPQTILKDGDILLIPSAAESPSLRISVNTADVRELMLLPGIGESTAESIVEYRNEHGLFQTIDELMEVRGIGPKKLEALREYVVL